MPPRKNRAAMSETPMRDVEASQFAWVQSLSTECRLVDITSVRMCQMLWLGTARGLRHDFTNLSGEFLAFSKKSQNLAPVLPVAAPQLRPSDGGKVDAPGLSPSFVFL